MKKNRKDIERLIVENFHSLHGRMNEDPDRVRVDNTKSPEYYDNDALAFGYHKRKMYVSEPGETHPTIPIPGKDPDDQFGTSRLDFDFAGRAWFGRGIISFWEYPTKDGMTKLLNDLDNAIANKYHNRPNVSGTRDKWLIEVIPTAEMQKLADKRKYLQSNPNDSVGWNSWSFEARTGSKLIPLSEYQGSGEWSEAKKGKGHTDVGSGGKDVPDGVGSRKEVPGDADTKAEKRFNMGSIAEDALEESPDNVPYIKPGGSKVHELTYRLPGAYAFGYYDTEFHLSMERDTHSDIPILDDNEDVIYLDRGSFYHHGRIWVNQKSISFWNNPDPIDLKDILADIKYELKDRGVDVNFDDSWLIDVPKDKEKMGNVGRWDKSEVIPLAQYLSTSTKFDDPDNSIEHEKSPLHKTSKPVPRGFGSNQSDTDEPEAKRRFNMGAIAEEFLGEESLGTYDGRVWSDNYEPFEAYKNPNTIKRMSPNLRGISDAEGNLYVVDSGEVLHAGFADWLNQKGIIDANGFNLHHKISEYFTWQRKGTGNELYIGESVSKGLVDTKVDRLIPLIKAAMERNPQITFIPKSVSVSSSIDLTQYLE